MGIDLKKDDLNIFLRFFYRFLLHPFSLCSFRFFFIFFALFNFRSASDFYVSRRCETSQKNTFFASKRKKISFPFRFILLRSEN
jgi:hypothetical protein